MRGRDGGHPVDGAVRERAGGEVPHGGGEGGDRKLYQGRSRGRRAH